MKKTVCVTGTICSSVIALEVCLHQGSPTFLKLGATSRALSNAKGYHFGKTLLKEESCTGHL